MSILRAHTNARPHTTHCTDTHTHTTDGLDTMIMQRNSLFCPLKMLPSCAYYSTVNSDGTKSTSQMCNVVSITMSLSLDTCTQQTQNFLAGGFYFIAATPKPKVKVFFCISPWYCTLAHNIITT